jgi:hypothetical protein
MQQSQKATDPAPLDLAAIRARCDAATPGPWHIWRDLDYRGYYTVGDAAGVLTPERPETDECNPTAHVYIEPDAEFIARAREDIPALLAALDAAQAQLDLLGKSYEQVADERVEYAARLDAVRTVLDRLSGRYTVGPSNYLRVLSLYEQDIRRALNGDTDA